MAVVLPFQPILKVRSVPPSGLFTRGPRAREDQGSRVESSFLFYGTTPGATRAACPAPPLGSSSGRASVASCAPLHISGYVLHVFRGSLSLLQVERVLA